MGLLVIGLMQLGNFWFNAMKHRRDEEGVNRDELKEVETRLDSKISALERRVDRKTDQLRTDLREDFNNVFAQLKHLNATSSALSSTSELANQRMLALEAKIDVLTTKVK